MKKYHILLITAFAIAQAFLFNYPSSLLRSTISFRMSSNMPVFGFSFPKFASTALVSLGIITSAPDLSPAFIDTKLLSTTDTRSKFPSNSELSYLRKALKVKIENRDKTELELETVKKELTRAILREDDALRELKRSESAFKSVKSSSTNNKPPSAVQPITQEKFQILKIVR